MTGKRGQRPYTSTQAQEPSILPLQGKGFRTPYAYVYTNDFGMLEILPFSRYSQDEFGKVLEQFFRGDRHVGPTKAYLPDAVIIDLNDLVTWIKENGISTEDDL